MDFVSLDHKMTEAEKNRKRKIDLFGTENFRSWILYFQPGDGTDMHYHVSPETFPLVLFGNRSEAFGGPHVTFKGKEA